MTPDQRDALTAELIEFIRRPNTGLRELGAWFAERNLEPEFRITDAADPDKPGNFYVNGELALTHDEWAAKPVPTPMGGDE